MKNADIFPVSGSISTAYAENASIALVTYNWTTRSLSSGLAAAGPLLMTSLPHHRGLFDARTTQALVPSRSPSGGTAASPCVT